MMKLGESTWLQIKLVPFLCAAIPFRGMFVGITLRTPHMRPLERRRIVRYEHNIRHFLFPPIVVHRLLEEQGFLKNSS
jgi:hypothetical protein